MKRAAALLLGCGVLIGLLTGCYSRVVGASGLGAAKYTIEPSARSNTAADRAIDAWFAPTTKTLSRSSKWSHDSVDPLAVPRRRTPSLGVTQRAGMRTSNPGPQAQADAPPPPPPSPSPAGKPRS